MRFTLHRDKVERKIQTGHTSYECRRSCYLHCGANLRKTSPPSGVGVVKGTTTGSSISLSWNQPSDAGGRYAYSAASQIQSQRSLAPGKTPLALYLFCLTVHDCGICSSMCCPSCCAAQSCTTLSCTCQEGDKKRSTAHPAQKQP